MAFTHEFIINVNSINVTGEISFSGSTPSVKFNQALELPLEELNAVNRFFTNLKQFYSCCNETITDLRIREKTSE